MGGLLFLIKSFVAVSSAHESEVPHIEPEVEVVGEVASLQLDELIASYSVQTAYVAAASLGLLILIAIAVRYPSESLKRVLFWSITGIISLATLGLMGMTIYLNQVSVTKGPVHWHADYQVWACGNLLDLVDPEGLSNRVGTASFHEHDDNRVHVEGVVVNYADVNLGAYFKTVGGSLTSKSLTFPTNEGKKTFITGQKCGNSDEEAVLQTFVLETDLDSKTYTQRKISNSQNFQYRQEAQVPPGNCIIIEFDREKDRTEKLCQTYRDSLTNGKLLKEVPYVDHEEVDHTEDEEHNADGHSHEEADGS